MNAPFRCACAVALVIALPPGRGHGVPQAFDWQAAAPESQSVSGRALDELKDRLAAANTKAFLVVRNDRVIPSPDGAGTGADRPAAPARRV